MTPMKERIVSSNVAEYPPGQWSNCILAGDTLWLSGFTARSNDSRPSWAWAMPTKARVIFTKVRHCLEAAGASMADVVNMNIYVTDMADNKGVWRGRQEFFEGDIPASTLVQVAGLGAPGHPGRDPLPSHAVSHARMSGHASDKGQAGGAMKRMSYLTPRGPGFGVVQWQELLYIGRRLGPNCPDLQSALALGLLPRIATLARELPPDLALDEVRALPVIPRPGRIVCVGLNYLEHRLEGHHAPRAAAPSIFLRLPDSQVGHGEPLLCPRESERFDFEAEVAVVIGRAGRRIPEASALEDVAGLTAYTDASVRDWQAAAGQWTRARTSRPPAPSALGW